MLAGMALPLAGGYVSFCILRFVQRNYISSFPNLRVVFLNDDELLIDSLGVMGQIKIIWLIEFHIAGS